MPGYHTDDTRIEQGDELLAPMQIMRELKASEITGLLSISSRIMDRLSASVALKIASMPANGPSATTTLSPDLKSRSG